MTVATGTEVVTVPTAGGNVARITARPDTNDAALAMGIIGGAEYPFDRLQGLSGWAIDIGAHIGIVTVALALDNADLRIVAVEALPENAALLRENVALNGLDERVTVLERAAGSPNETTVPITYGWSRADNQPDGFMHDSRYIGGMVGPNETSTTIDCPAVSLGQLIEAYEMDRVTLVKIDCEGCEWHFLDTPRLDEVDHIVGELHWGRNGGAAEFRRLLKGFTVDMDDTRNVAVFEATRRMVPA